MKRREGTREKITTHCFKKELSFKQERGHGNIDIVFTRPYSMFQFSSK